MAMRHKEALSKKQNLPVPVQAEPKLCGTLETHDAGEARDSTIEPAGGPSSGKSRGGQNNTLVRKGPANTEATDTAGLSRGESHPISGLTAGETANVAQQKKSRAEYFRNYRKKLKLCPHCGKEI